MGIEDEKTRPALRAVKRKLPVAEQETRAVKAVRRKTPATLPEDRLLTPFRVHLLPRGELLNAAGEADNGWVVRDEGAGTECLRFVLAKESVAATLGRAVLAAARYFLDTMDGERNRGGLILDAVAAEGFGRQKRAPREGSGHLFGPDGARDSGFVLRPRYAVVCLDAASQVVFECLPAPDGARVMARRRTIAVVRTLQVDGLIGSRHGGLEVVFEKSASPSERLRLVAGMTLCEAWLYERKRYAAGPLGNDLDLGTLFGLD